MKLGQELGRPQFPQASAQADSIGILPDCLQDSSIAVRLRRRLRERLSFSRGDDAEQVSDSVSGQASAVFFLFKWEEANFVCSTAVAPSATRTASFALENLLFSGANLVHCHCPDSPFRPSLALGWANPPICNHRKKPQESTYGRVLVSLHRQNGPTNEVPANSSAFNGLFAPSQRKVTIDSSSEAHSQFTSM
jgi:hypothetical protein